MKNKYQVSATNNNEVILSVANLGKQENIKKGHNGAADFEEAIDATGFGFFNVILILIAIPAGWSAVFETTSMSYVFPAAQCDLDLSLNQKGLLNAITYTGMISSAIFWGFFADTIGRRTILLAGFILEGIIDLICSFTQSATVLMVMKYFGGFIMSGPSAIIMAYLSEFHVAKYRAKFQLILGSIFSLGTVVMPLVAWAILPRNLDVTILGFDLHSWNFFLMIFSTPAILSGIIFIFLPESPKFLMTTGKNAKALTVLRSLYHLNKRRPREEYPVTELVDEIKLRVQSNSSNAGTVTANRSKLQAVREGLQQLKPLLFPPHVFNIILVCTIQGTMMMSLNTLRLWMPQIFQAMADYEYLNKGSSSDLCTMLEIITPKEDLACIVNTSDPTVYLNNIIIPLTAICGYAVLVTFINKLGKKKILFALGVSGGLCGIGLYFAKTPLVTLILSAATIATGSIGNNVLVSVVVDLFPTTYRSMAIALCIMTGRAGAMLGNLIFPFLLKTGCAPPFIFIGIGLISSGLLSLVLPNTDLKAME